MRAPPVVAGVLAQVEELLDVDVPGLQVGADGALALAALVDRDRGVVGDLQERHHAGGQPVGALDVRADTADRGPVVAETAGELRQQGVVLDRLEDVVQVVLDRGQEAGRQLRPGGAGVEQRRRGAHEVEAGDQPVELDRPAPRGPTSRIARPIATRMKNACGSS